MTGTMSSRRPYQPIFRGTLGALGVLACVGVAWIIWAARRDAAERLEGPYRSQNGDPRCVLDSTAESQVVAFCSDCHRMPRPESFPRDRWHKEVQLGYEFYARSGRNDLTPPPMHQAVAYFRSRAPRELVFPCPEEAKGPLKTTFSTERLAWAERQGRMPEISHMRLIRFGSGNSPVLIVCDMLLGKILSVDLRNPRLEPKRLAQLNHPAHVEPCDLDNDGNLDFVVADLGSSRPSDHDRGRVVWLRLDASGSAEAMELATKLGRVADVRVADFDGDERPDLVVAEFGHYQTGRILLLENRTPHGGPLCFDQQVLDTRPGTIHVPVHDFDGDGRPDFVALISQEWEHVEMFLNRSAGRFERRVLWAGPDLAFGSSGIELVDLDQDGDIDVLYTNGDAWDNLYATASHGVQWLENRGDLRFEYHRLTAMPGAYRALAGDLDLDGDNDIIATAWLPPPVMPEGVLASPVASIVCLEQKEPGVFVRHTLETGSPNYATFELADFDGDGDLDFAVGPGPHVANGREDRNWLTIWRNEHK